MWIPICLMSLFLGQDKEIDVQESLRVEFVTLDILALDKKGNPVTDLVLSDFEVKEKRKKVQVTLFEKLDLRSTSEFIFSAPESLESGTEASKPTPVQRQVQQIILALDMEDIDTVGANKTFSQLKEFVEGLDRLVPYSINVYSLDLGSITKGFTRDQESVLSAIEQIKRNYFDVRMGTGTPTMLGGLSGRDGRSRSRGTGTFGQLEEQLRACKRSGSIDCINFTVSEFMEQQWMRTNRVMGELESLADRFTRGDGLKSMILVSPGFAMGNMSAVIRLRDVILGGSGEETLSNMSTHLFNGKELREKYQVLLHSCLIRRVIFNTFDIFNGTAANSRGISARFAGNDSASVQTIYQAYSREISNGLSSLARDTGGSFYQSFKFGTPIKKVIETSRFYYQLGYTSPEGKAGKWRKIKIKCKRKGVKLRYRAGYYGR